MIISVVIKDKMKANCRRKLQFFGQITPSRPNFTRADQNDLSENRFERKRLASGGKLQFFGQITPSRPNFTRADQNDLSENRFERKRLASGGKLQFFGQITPSRTYFTHEIKIERK